MLSNSSILDTSSTSILTTNNPQTASMTGTASGGTGTMTAGGTSGIDNNIFDINTNNINNNNTNNNTNNINNNNYVYLQQNEEISTIFVVGFPDDMYEREFQNMFLFCPGWEAATLKIPNHDDPTGKKQIVS